MVRWVDRISTQLRLFKLVSDVLQEAASFCEIVFRAAVMALPRL